MSETTNAPKKRSSAEKQRRQSESRRMRNKSYKSAMRTQVKKFLTYIQEGNAEKAKAELPKTMGLIDKLGQKGVLHDNNVARKKARLHHKYNQMVAAKSTSKA